MTNIQSLQATVIELANKAATDGKEEWLALAAEMLRNGGEDVYFQGLPMEKDDT